MTKKIVNRKGVPEEVEIRSYKKNGKPSFGIKRQYQGTRPPHLLPIDLGKRKDCDHPEIETLKFYLVQYDGRFFAGQFEKEWYGWNFDGVYDAGTQLDDYSIQAIWEIIPQVEPKKTEIVEYCETEECCGILEHMKTCKGDPEGIRGDRWCPVCGIIWGCTKARRHKIGILLIEHR
jgi:hypothetical protein